MALVAGFGLFGAGFGVTAGALRRSSLGLVGLGHPLQLTEVVLVGGAVLRRDLLVVDGHGSRRAAPCRA